MFTFLSLEGFEPVKVKDDPLGGSRHISTELHNAFPTILVFRQFVGAVIFKERLRSQLARASVLLLEDRIAVKITDYA